MNDEEFIEAGKEWLIKEKSERMKRHNECATLSRRKYAVRDKRKNIARSKEYRESHPEQIKEYMDKNKEKINVWKSNYKKTEKGRASNQRYKTQRRSKEASVPNTLTFDEWLGILGEYNYRCAYCGIPFDDNNRPERDHVIPVSKGGGNTKDNIVPSCRLCNAKKGDRIL